VQRAGHFFTTNCSYQLTHCTNLKYFNGVELEKNIIATKMKENG